ncbi:MAG: leucine-rich repeat domain-containing protein [Methanomassiliicoccales archaeon]|nr:leucine-rich repeat domain-containing protein [Methanomassiliicoccales archaeon]
MDGDYIYTVNASLTEATIKQYVGLGGDITIPSTLGGYQTAVIQHEAFSYPGGLLVTSVIIPNNVITIEDYAFANCILLTSAYIGSGVTSFGEQAFLGCDSLVSITVDDSNPSYRSIVGVLYDKDLTTLIKCPSAKAGEVIIPHGVTSIGWYAFDSCKLLEHLAMGNGITSIKSYTFYESTALESVTFTPNSNLVSIGERAFDSCTSLKAIDLPDKLETIGDSAFRSCTSLTPLNIPGNVTSIESGAFSECTSLTGVMIPASVTSIGNYAFGGCNNLTSIDVEEANANYSSIDGVLYNKTATALLQYPAGKAGVLVLPSSATEIERGACINCYNLTSVTMGDDVATIGWGAFYGCSNLTSVTMGKGITTIGLSAFLGCTGLSSIVIPASVTTIGDFAFFGCYSLTNITFLGLVSPLYVGQAWITDTPATLRGHADPDSNFPVPGATFYGLTMGYNIEAPEPESNDNTILIILAVIAIIAVLVAVIMLMRKRKGKA